MTRALGAALLGGLMSAAAGRTYIIPDDIKALADPVLSHRLVLSSDAQLQGISAGKVVADVLGAVPVPTGK